MVNCAMVARFCGAAQLRPTAVETRVRERRESRAGGPDRDAGRRMAVVERGPDAAGPLPARRALGEPISHLVGVLAGNGCGFMGP